MTFAELKARAAAKGATRYVEASCDAYDLAGWIAPDADLDGRFTLYPDEPPLEGCREVLRINGWLWSIEDAAEPA